MVSEIEEHLLIMGFNHLGLNESPIGYPPAYLSALGIPSRP